MKCVIDEVCAFVYRMTINGEEEAFFNIAFEPEFEWLNEKVKELTSEGYKIVWNVEEVVYE